MKKIRSVLIVIIVILVVAGGILLDYLSTERIEDNPPGTLGNTAGNLNNGGCFCELDGIVYFSNFYDNGTLYRMNADESDIVKLNNQTVRYLNAAGRHLYYFQADNRNGNDLGSVIKSTGLYRCATNGKNVECLKRGTMDTLLVNGNSIYYQYYNDAKEFTMYRISTSGTEDTQVTDYIANPACANGSSIYFHGTENDHNLYRLDTEAGDNITRIWSGQLWNPAYSDGYIYYMDLSRHYALSRLNLSTGEAEALTSERTDFFNVSADYVFYQTTDTDSPALKRINKDGSGETILAEGYYHNISVTSQYLYFTAFGDDTRMYHCPLYSDYPEEFTSAAGAVSSDS